MRIHRMWSLGFLVLLLLPVPTAPGQEAGPPVFALPDAVKAELSLPEVPLHERLPEGERALEVAIVTREGEPCFFLDGRSRRHEDEREVLRRIAELRRDPDDPARCSLTPVVLHADAGATWRWIWRLLRACADPEVRMPRIYWAVRTPKGPGVLPVFLPPYNSVEGGSSVLVQLVRPEGTNETRLILGDREVGRGDRGYGPLYEELARIGREPQDRGGSLRMDWGVPLADLARAVAGLRMAGLTPVVFASGLPIGVEPDWTVPEPVRAGLRLPAARSGEAPEPGSRRFEIACLEAGDVLFADGRRLTLAGLAEVLRGYSRFRREGGADGLSRLPVLVLASAELRWREIDWILRACADPEVRIFRVAFAVRDGEAERILPVPLPTVAPPPDVAWLTIRLEGDPDLGVSVLLRDESLGKGEEGLKRLAAALASVRKRYPDKTIHGAIAVGGEVPYGSVVRVLDELLGIGVTKTTFLGD